jgi:hypothetical protein
MSSRLRAVDCPKLTLSRQCSCRHPPIRELFDDPDIQPCADRLACSYCDRLLGFPFHRFAGCREGVIIRLPCSPSSSFRPLLTHTSPYSESHTRRCLPRWRIKHAVSVSSATFSARIEPDIYRGSARVAAFSIELLECSPISLPLRVLIRSGHPDDRLALVVPLREIDADTRINV